MTKLEPITSEEVLERQVKENAKAADSQVSPSQEPKTTVTAAPTQNDELGQSATSTQQREMAEVAKQDALTAGFTYRLPLGAYLLSFLYAQIFVIVALSVLVGAAVAMSYDQDIDKIINSTQRETWGLMVVCAVFSFFIFSGNNVLRLLTIGGASVATLVLGYQLANSLSTLLKYDGSFGSLALMSAFITPYVIAYVVGIMLLVATIIYLLRKKVSSAYN